MTNTEAIEILHGRKLTMSMGFLGDEKEFVKSVNEAINMAITALEKQEAKKPIYEKLVYEHHDWKRKENGEIDEFAMDYETHNGPMCTKCYHSFCMFCCDDYEAELNKGPCDCSYYKCPTCGSRVNKLDNVCDCGQRIDWSED